MSLYRQITKINDRSSCVLVVKCVLACLLASETSDENSFALPLPNQQKLAKDVQTQTKSRRKNCGEVNVSQMRTSLPRFPLCDLWRFFKRVPVLKKGQKHYL